MEQLHPNWRALATVHLPLKRFVREGVVGMEAARDESKYKYHVDSGTGTQAQRFYEDVVGSSSSKRTTSGQIHKATNVTDKTFRNAKMPFDSKKFFRYAMEDRADDLMQFDYADSDSVNITDSYGWSALMMAACEGAKSAVRALLQMGADKAIKDKRGYTALDLALKNKHQNIAQMLQSEACHNNGAADTTNVHVESAVEPFHCDVCKRNFSDSTMREHLTSTIHQFNAKSTLPPNKLVKFNVPAKNRGLQLMVKQGWDAESGLGPERSGRLYPIKTVIRKKRTGLGIEQAPARVTHFAAFDTRATQRQDSDYYRRKPRNRNDIEREKKREWKRERRLRNALS